MKLVPDWRRAHRFRSVQLALFWSVLNGAVLSIEAFQNAVNPWIFLGLNVVGYGLIGLARITKQPGLE